MSGYDDDPVTWLLAGAVVLATPVAIGALVFTLWDDIGWLALLAPLILIAAFIGATMLGRFLLGGGVRG